MKLPPPKVGVGATPNVITGVVLAARLNVAVTCCFLPPMPKAHVVPALEQPTEGLLGGPSPPALEKLHPTKTDPVDGVAVSVTASVSPNARVIELQLGSQLIAPPPTEEEVLVTVPVPVPAFVTIKFLLSLNAV